MIRQMDKAIYGGLLHHENLLVHTQRSFVSNMRYSGTEKTVSTAMKRWDHAPFFPKWEESYTIPFYIRKSRKPNF